MRDHPTYYVKDGHTLGYLHPSQPGMFCVLQGSVIRGGHDWKSGPVPLCPSDTLVPATVQDFADFRVCHRGHLPEDACGQGDDFEADPAAYDAKSALMKPAGDPLREA